MKFFLDTADVEAISELNDLGMVDGVTTNPSIIAKSGRNILEVTKEICDIVDGPVSAEVVSIEALLLLDIDQTPVSPAAGLFPVNVTADSVLQNARLLDPEMLAFVGPSLIITFKESTVEQASASPLVPRATV